MHTPQCLFETHVLVDCFMDDVIRGFATAEESKTVLQILFQSIGRLNNICPFCESFALRINDLTREQSLATAFIPRL